jgi:elongator complex protein 2
MTNNDVEQ